MADPGLLDGEDEVQRELGAMIRLHRANRERGVPASTLAGPETTAFVELVGQTSFGCSLPA